MIIDEEEFKKLPNMAKYPEEEKIFFYIIEIGRYENYNDAMDFMAENLKAPEEFKQVAASQALQMLVSRFRNIKDDIILPLLFKCLKSDSKYFLFLGEIMNTLGDIAHLVPRLKQKIYLTCFENGIDFFTGKKLEVFTDKTLVSSLNSEEEKKEFILSFCQNSQNYQEALEVCLHFLKENESNFIHIAALQGLTYLIFRFKKMSFDVIYPFIKKFLDSQESIYIYAESILADIAITIPELKEKAISLLKEIESGYLELYNLKKENKP